MIHTRRLNLHDVQLSDVDGRARVELRSLRGAEYNFTNYNFRETLEFVEKPLPEG